MIGLARLAPYLAAAAVLGLIVWRIDAAAYDRGAADVRAEWAAQVAEAERITRAAIEAAEADKAALRDQLAAARSAASRARGGVEAIDADGVAALEAIR